MAALFKTRFQSTDFEMIRTVSTASKATTTQHPATVIANLPDLPDLPDRVTSTVIGGVQQKQQHNPETLGKHGSAALAKHLDAVREKIRRIAQKSSGSSK